MTKLMSLKTKTTVAAALVKTLLKLDVDSIFGYPGASVLSIYNELSSESKIKHYLVRHEQAAVHAAEGYARVSGKTGVVLVTSGPGFTNTITGIANAYADSTPLVILAGQVTKADKKGKIFQNVDIASIVKTCSKKVFTVTQDDDIEEMLENAFFEANSGIKGPVVVILPRNILESEYKAKRKTFYEIKPDVCDFALARTGVRETVVERYIAGFRAQFGYVYAIVSHGAFHDGEIVAFIADCQFCVIWHNMCSHVEI